MRATVARLTSTTRSRSTRAPVAGVEACEARRLLAGISGAVFNDANADGLRGAAEGGWGGAFLYVDANHNGSPDVTSQDFRGAETPFAIHDQRTSRSRASVSDVTGPVRRIEVSLYANHERPSDLTATLISPAGTRVELFSHGAAAPGDLSPAVFADDGSAPFGVESPDLIHRPNSPLSAVAGEDPNGMWTLEVSDDVAGVDGTLGEWSILFQTGEPLARSDAAGRYAFAGQPAGTHTVRLVENEFASQTAPELEQGRTITVAEGDSVTLPDFGLRSFHGGAVSGHVYADANDNGALDAGEAGIAGRTVYFDVNDNGRFDGEVRSGFVSTDVPKPLADAQREDDERSITTSTLDVAGLPADLFGMTVTVDLDHSKTSDLILTLVSPVGLRYELVHYPSPGSSTGIHETFDVAAAAASQEEKNGIWTLEVLDSQPGNTGTLNNWSVSFVTRAAEPNTTTGPDGGYELGDFGGTVTVRQVVPEGQSQSQPAPGTGYSVLLAEEGVPGKTRQFGVSTKPASATVVGRHVFYNHSSYDGNNPGATAADDAAIATDKRPLLANEDRLPGFDNVTSYDKGINGVMIDVRNLPVIDALLDVHDFEFSPAGNVPTSVSVRPGAGAGGSDRVTLTWRNYNPLDASPLPQAVGNGWLTVTMKANYHTGLAQPDVFSIGNLIGETGDGGAPAGWRVSALDLSAVKRTLNSAAPIDNATDFNRDGRTNALDLTIVRRYLNQSLPLFPGPVPTAALRSEAAGAGGVTREILDV